MSTTRNRTPEPSSRRAPFFRRHPRITLAVVTIAMLLVADVALAQVLAMTDLYVTPARAESRFRREHPVYDHDLVPGVVDAAGWWGPYRYHVTTDQLGFRDASAREVPLVADHPRLLLIGDSFTEGTGVEYEESFAGRLAATSAAKGVEVLNAGVVSYAPTAYLAKVRYLLDQVGLRFDRLVVCIDVSDVYDEVAYYAKVEHDERTWFRLDEVDDVFRRVLHRNTVLCDSLAGLLRAAKSDDVDPVEAVRDDRRAAWSYDESALADYGRAGLLRATERMSELRALATSRGIAMTVVVYPWPCHILRRQSESLHNRHWREWATAEGVEFIDLTPFFLAAGEPEDVVRGCFLTGDAHWNPAGHALVAEALAARL